MSLATTGRVGLAFNAGGLYVEADGAIAGLDPDTGERRWTVDYPTLAGVQDGVLFAADDDSVAAVPASGVVDWVVSGRFLGAGGPSVFVLDESSDGSAERPLIRAHDPGSGRVQWRYRLTRPVSWVARLHALDLVYLVDRAAGDPPTARVVALDPGSATEAWTRDLGPASIPQTVAGSGRLVVGTERPTGDARATATELAPDGTTRWRRRWDRAFAFPRALGVFETVVELAARSAAGPRTTVVLRGTVPSERAVRARGRFVALDGDGDRVVLLSDGALVARDVSDGGVEHRVGLGEHLDTPGGSDSDLRATAIGSTVYVAAGRTLLAVDLEEGVRWTFEADRPVWLLGVVDGVVYAGNGEAVYALDPL